VISIASDLLRRTVAKWRADRAPDMAAALTYYILLSLAPMLVLLVGVLGRYVGRASVSATLYERAYAVAGSYGEQLARDLVAATQPSTLGTAASLLALVIAIWGAMRMFRQMRLAFDRMWHIPQEEPPGAGVWARARWTLSVFGGDNLAAFLMVLAVAGLLLASAVMSSLMSTAAQLFAPLFQVGDPAMAVAESVLSAALITLLFALIYRYLPRTSVGWRDVWVGAGLTAALFILGRTLLATYFTYASPGSAYGAAGSVLAFLLWVNYSVQIVLFGAEFTWVWAHTRGSLSERRGTER
jgi:membrane protein